MTGSATSLFSLPPEVRLSIWSYLFADESIVIGPYTGDSELEQHKQRQPRPQKSPHSTQYGAPIARTCRLLRHETEAIYFRHVHVRLDINESRNLDSLHRFLNAIGDANCSHFEHFDIRWSNYVDITIDLFHHRRRSRDTSTVSDHATAVSPRGTTFPAEPPTSTRIGSSNTTTVRGIPLSCSSPGAAARHQDFWEQMGTTHFCAALADVLCRNLDDRWCTTGSNGILATGSGAAASISSTPALMVRPAVSSGCGGSGDGGGGSSSSSSSSTASDNARRRSITSAPSSLSKTDIMALFAALDSHASSLKWLWFW